MSEQERTLYTVKVTRGGWFNFEGFGRPFEGWVDVGGKGLGWRSAGRAFTWTGARRKAIRSGKCPLPQTSKCNGYLSDCTGDPSCPVHMGAFTDAALGGSDE